MIEEQVEVPSRCLSRFGAAGEQVALIDSERGFDVVRVAGERVRQLRSIIMLLPLPSDRDASH